MKLLEPAQSRDMRANDLVRVGAVMIAVPLTAGILRALASTAMAAASQHRSHSSQHHTTPAPPRIACTQLGCQPVPAGCMPVPQLTWDDLPTGFDAIDCPPGVSPLR